MKLFSSTKNHTIGKKRSDYTEVSGINGSSAETASGTPGKSGMFSTIKKLVLGTGKADENSSLSNTPGYGSNK